MTKPTNIIYPSPQQRRYKLYKHSDSTTDYQIDWQQYLEATESISSQTLSANNITVDSNSSSGQVTTMFISGGEPKTNAYIDITITTDNSTARTFKIRVYFTFELSDRYEDPYYYT